MAYKKGDAIEDSEELWRSYYSNPIQRAFDPNCTMAHSRVFKLRPKDEGRLSVDVSRLTTYGDSIGDPSEYLLFGISAGDVHGIDGLKTHYSPLIDNLAHTDILGIPEGAEDVVPGLLARRAYPVPDPSTGIVRVPTPSQRKGG